MASVTYIQHDGSERKVDVPSGKSIMQGAIDNMIGGITAECGGSLACATCHCYVDDAWVAKVGEPSRDEAEMLEAVAAERRPSSRLCCQITVTDALDGLVIHVPDTQY